MLKDYWFEVGKRLLDTAKSMPISEYIPKAPVLLYNVSHQDTVDTCLGPNTTHYLVQISFQNGSVTENVNIAECTAGRCSHTFEPPTNPPSSYDSVSVAAENMVGVGAARTCTTQTISESYSLTKSSETIMHMNCVSAWVCCGWCFVCHRFANTLLIVLSLSKNACA